MNLKQWLQTSRFDGSPSLLAKYLDVPYKTVEGWVYEQKTPKLHTRLRLYFLTGLDRFAPNGREEEAAYEAVVQEELDRARHRAERLEETVEEFWEEAEFFLLAPNESRDQLEQHVGRDELRSLSSLFQLLANPDQFQVWSALQSIKQTLELE